MGGSRKVLTDVDFIPAVFTPLSTAISECVAFKVKLTRVHILTICAEFGTLGYKGCGTFAVNFYCNRKLFRCICKNNQIL